jgi:Tfp pilus assembly protein PilE
MQAVIARINLAFGVVFLVVGVLCLITAPRRSAVVARQLRSAAVACFVAVAVMLVLHFVTG